jgi:hypothetical protein
LAEAQVPSRGDDEELEGVEGRAVSNKEPEMVKQMPPRQDKLVKAGIEKPGGKRDSSGHPPGRVTGNEGRHTSSMKRKGKAPEGKVISKGG